MSLELLRGIALELLSHVTIVEPGAGMPLNRQRPPTLASISLLDVLAVRLSPTGCRYSPSLRPSLNSYYADRVSTLRTGIILLTE